MALVSELELPFFDHTEPSLGGERYREAMAALRGYDGWLASCPFGFMVLDRESSEFFLRTKDAVFPGPGRRRGRHAELEHRAVTFPANTVVLVSAWHANRDGVEPEEF